jgi:hypothetical protein
MIDNSLPIPDAESLPLHRMVLNLACVRAVSNCRYGVCESKIQKKCRNGPALSNGAGTFEEATTLRVQCRVMMPIHQNKVGFNGFLQLFECPEPTLNIFVLLIVSFLWQEQWNTKP